MWICNKCKQIITKTDRSIECKNAHICGNRLHGKCANLKEGELRMLESNANISWECDACLRKADIYKVPNKTIVANAQNIKLKKFVINYRRCLVALCVVFSMAMVCFFTMGVHSLVSRSQFEMEKRSVNNEKADKAINTIDYTLCIVNRTEWRALSPKNELLKLDLPVHRIIISNTFTNDCSTKETCSFRTRTIQKQQMKIFNWDDIGYNFLIGGDGCVYEGRGWDYQGAHTKGYNKDSYGISFIGTFTTRQPTDSQIEAVKLLLANGVLQHKISSDYHVYTFNQLSGTKNPEDALFQVIKTWQQFSMNMHNSTSPHT